MLVKKVTYSREIGYLISSCIGKSIILMLLSSSRDNFTLLWQNSVTDVSVGFQPPFGAHPDGLQHGISKQISLNLVKTLTHVLTL